MERRTVDLDHESLDFLLSQSGPRKIVIFAPMYPISAPGLPVCLFLELKQFKEHLMEVRMERLSPFV